MPLKLKKFPLSLGRKMYSSLRARLLIAVDPVAFARKQGVEVGEGASLIGITGGTFGSEPHLIKLGDHVRVTAGVHFVTHDGGVWVFRREDPGIQVIAGITVGNNVHIGLNATIMPNVRVGNNVVIGVGSVVTHDVPDDCVVAGVPARVICSIEEYRIKCQGRRVD
jgi:carbonic anhydrase/acetyltransferase-like protein (isoleucine patch superfamily)